MTSSSLFVLKQRRRPSQTRAAQTLETILDTTAHLLKREGFERISTNMICKEAGLTPPALYRYFPNKYAVLQALGERLMKRQNEVLISTTAELNDHHFREGLQNILQKQYEVTVREIAGENIIRSLRAIPLLSQVRIDSHTLMSEQLVIWLQPLVSETDPNVLKQRIRMSIEIGYAMLEYLFDDPKADRDLIFLETARVLEAVLLARP